MLAVLLVALARILVPGVATTTKLETRDVQSTLVVVGYVRAPSIAQLGAAVPGVVSSVLAREGERVRSGAVLVQLDDREARASVAEAEARLVEVTSAVKGDIERAEAEFEQAERDLERIGSVVAQGGLTRQRLEQAEQRVVDARSRLEVTRSIIAPSGASAAVAGAQAALEAARARLDLSRVVAPADGMVLRRRVEPGDAVQAGRVLMELAAEGPTEVVAFPSEQNLAHLRVGAPARVSADAFPGDTFSARLERIAPSVDPAQGTIEVRLAVEDPPTFLRPDMTLSLNIELERRSGVTVLPVAAVRGIQTAEPWVGVVRNGRIERRTVVTGLQGDDFVEVQAGLDLGEHVVVGREDLAPGARVRTEG